MARSRFGGTSSDFVYNAILVDVTRKVPELAALTLTFWSAKTAGTQYTDILDESLAATGGIVNAASDGHIPLIYGPDGILEMWVEAGGTRWRMVNTDAASIAAGVTASAASAAAAAASAASAAALTTVDSATAVYIGNPSSLTTAALKVRDNVRNVKDYGAVGDGVTNDVAAINAAVTAAGTGGRVYFPPAVYAVASQFSIGSVTLEGAVGAELKKTGSSGFFFTIAAGSTGTTVRGLKINGNSLCTGAVVNLAAGATSDVTIEQCTITNAGTVAIKIRDGNTKVAVRWCTIDGADQGFYIDGACSFVTLAHNRIKNWKVRGVYVLGDVVGTGTGAPSDVTLLDNRITDLVSGSAVARQPITFEGDDSNLLERVKVLHNTVIGPGYAWTTNDPWAGSVAYAVGATVQNGGKNYKATTAGTSAASGGPSGTGTGIADGSVVWSYVSAVAPFPGTADQISLHRCADFAVIGNVSMYGGDGGMAIGGNSVRGVVANNVCSFNDVTGIFLSSQTSTLTNVTVTGNTLMNNGQNRNGDRNTQSRSGIRPYFANKCVITGNTLGDDQATKTQNYGVSMTANTDLVIGTNIDAGNILGLYNIDANANVNVTGAIKPQELLSAAAVGPSSATTTTVWTPANIPAGTFVVGSEFELDLKGTIDNKASPSGLFTGRIQMGSGSTVVATFTNAASQTGGVATNVPWSARLRIVVEALGASGVVTVTGQVFGVAAGGLTWTAAATASYSTTVNISAGLAIVVQLGMGTSDPANINRLNRATLRQVV